MRESMYRSVREGAPGVVYSFLRQRDIKLKDAGKKPYWVDTFEDFAMKRLGAD